MSEKRLEKFSDSLKKQKFSITKVMKKENDWYIFYASNRPHNGWFGKRGQSKVSTLLLYREL